MKMYFIVFKDSSSKEMDSMVVEAKNIKEARKEITDLCISHKTPGFPIPEKILLVEDVL